MPRMWDLDDLAGIGDLARALGVGKAAVSNWTRRHADFPTPLTWTSSGPLFSMEQVRAWHDGREWAHSGPGSAGNTYARGQDQ